MSTRLAELDPWRPSAFHDLAAFSLRDMTTCSADLRRLGAGMSSQHDVAQRIAQHLYACLADRESGVPNCALVRVFLTRPYEELDEEAKGCAREVLGREPRSPGMTCFALAGTAGERPEWNDVSRSRRYRAMPLVSEHFVARLPMFAQLVRKFGLALQPVPESSTDILVEWEEKEQAVFYVPEAVGSPFVPGQDDFVIPCGVRSVLGFGGVLPSGNLFAVVLFSKAHIPQGTADLFKALALSTKLALLPTDRVSGPPQSDPDPARAQAGGAAPPDPDLPTEPADLGRLRAEVAVMRRLLDVQEAAVVVQADRMTRALDVLRDSERRFQLITQATGALMWDWNLTTDGVWLSDAVETVFGYSKGSFEPTGRWWADCLHPEDRDRVLVGIQACIATGARTWFDQYRFRRGDGTYAHIFDQGYVLRAPDDKPIRMIGAMRDVSEDMHRIEVEARRVDTLRRHQEALVGLMKRPELHQGKLPQAFRAITEACAKTTEVARVGIWLFTPKADAIELNDLYELPEDRHSSGTKLVASAYPAYFRSLQSEERALPAEDAHVDLRTRELSASYLTPLGIGAMLDAPIRIGDRVVGLLRLEHVGGSRQWTLEEQSLAASLATKVTLALKVHQLREGEERFRQVMENIHEIFWITDPDKNQIVYISPAYERIWGRSCESLYANPRAWFDAIHPDDRERVLEAALTKQVEGTYDEEYRILRQDGSMRRIRDRAFPIRNESGVVDRIAGLAEDCTDRKEAEEVLERSLAQSRELVRRHEEVREQERSRIARELHDELGVGLTCLKMDLARLIWLGGGGGSRNDRKQVEEKVRSMTEQVDLTLQSVQRLASELRPGILDDLGLVAAVEWQCGDFAKRSGIACVFTGGGEEFEIGPLSATALFRICQGALINVARHAQATAVSVRLEQLNGYVSLTVQDNGVGIPQAKLEDPFSFGLLGMRERAHDLKGTLDITGNHEEGTTVTCRVPLK